MIGEFTKFGRQDANYLMIKYLLCCFFLAALWPAISNAAFSHDPELEWKTLLTENFEIHFHNGEEQLVPKVAQVAESAHLRVSRFFDWVPKSRTHLILTDRMDFTNAFAMPVPRNTMFIIVTPPDDVETIVDYHDWLELVITHEYTHIIHVDKASGTPEGARNVFGRIALFFPNALQPLWVLEGLASYLESQLSPGIGRATNSAFRNLMRLEVENGIKPISQVNLPIVSWPAGTTRYLYGVYFFKFLSETYGEDQVKRWVDNYSSNLIPFKINSNSKDIFGKNMSQLWDEFSAYLKKEFQPEIEKIKQAGISAGQKITNHEYQTGYPRATANGDVIYFKSNWLNQSELVEHSTRTQTERTIAKVYNSRFDIHPDRGILIAQIDNYKNVNYFSDLYQIDTESGDITRLTEGQRYKHAAWSPDGKNIIAVQVQQGNSALHLLDNGGKFLDSLWQSNNTEIVSELDWHPTKPLIVAAVWRPETRWNLELFDLEKKQWNKITQTDSTEMQPQFSHDGNSIIFSADYSVANNIYRLDLEPNSISQITNVLGGALSATQGPGNSDYYYMEQHNTGSDIYYLPAEDALNKPVEQVNPSNVAQSTEKEKTVTDNITETATPYNAFNNIYPTAWLPFIELTEDTSTFGFSTYGTDPLNWHQYSLFAAVDTDNNWPVGGLIYSYDRWRTAFKLFVQRDVNIVRDNLDNINSYRNSDTATFEAVLPFFSRDRQWSIHAGISMERETDRQIEPGGLAYPSANDELIGLALTYNSAKFFPRGISLQDGYKWRLVAEDSETLHSDFTGQVFTLDWRGYFSLGNTSHVLATRIVSASSTDSPNPFRLGGLNDGFYFASPGETLIEPTQFVFNKRDYALRGYKEGLPELKGSHMALAEIEWRFPISTIERGFMAPPIGINKLYGKIFYSAGDAWYDDSESADYFESAGIEINADMVFGYFIPLNVKLGYANGFDDLGEEEVYLQFGLSF